MRRYGFPGKSPTTITPSIIRLQVGERSFEEQARGSMVASIVESDFYTQMRTNQQLGYIVWSFNNSIEERLFFKMIIQSAGYGPFELQKRVEEVDEEVE